MGGLHLAVFLFGLAGLFGKLLTLPSTAIVFGRTAIAALVLALLSLSKRKLLPTKLLFYKTIPSGALLALHWVTFFHSIQVSSVAVGLLSTATFPIFLAFLEPCIARTEISTRDFALALIVCLGLALIVPHYDLGDNVFQGVLWGLVAGLSFALLTIWNRAVVKNVSALQLGLLQDFWAAILLSPFALPLFSISLEQVVLLILLGVLCTAVAHCLFIAALKSVRTQVAGMVTCLEPVYGAIFAALFLKEVPTLRELMGGVVILTAVTVSTLLENRRYPKSM